MTEVQRVRIYRLAAIGLAWMIPVVTGALVHFDPWGMLSAMFYPTVRKAILVAGIGLQIGRLARPAGGQRTIEYLDTQGELGILGLVVFLDLAIWYGNRGYGGEILQMGFKVVDWAMMIGLFAGRLRVVIDGNARTVTIGDVIPRTTSFDALRGLGLVETRMMRNGHHTGTLYNVGLFPQNGAPTKLDRCASVQEVDGRIRAIQMETGLQVARA